MMPAVDLPLGELMAKKTRAIDPKAYPDELFSLYSVPAFDEGMPQKTQGKDIGSSKQILEEGDVLLSKIVPNTRRAWVVSNDSGLRLIGSHEWIVFRGGRIVPEYLRHVLLGNDFHARFIQTVAGVGGSLVRARPSLVARIMVPIPSVAEQKRIARILDKAVLLRSQRRKSLNLLRDVRQSVIESMFSNDKQPGWSKSTLAEKLTFLTSGSRGWARYYHEKGDLFLRIQNVKQDELVLDDVARVQAPDTAEAVRTCVEPGDVLLSITADLGRTAVVPSGLGAAYINQHLAILRTDALHPRYLSACLSASCIQRQLLRKNRHGVKAGLNFNDIRSTIVPVPPQPVQDEFVKRLEYIDLVRDLSRGHLAQLESLFSSLQSRAFMGEL